MKEFRVSDGDLATNHSRQLDMVSGRDKLIQDLTLWLLEPLGTGYMTSAFGSTLNLSVGTGSNGRREGRFIGQPYDDLVSAEIEAEIDRVLNLYQQDQILKIRQAQIDGRLYLWNRREILDGINSITSTQQYDSAIVKVSITTGANQDINMIAELGNEETSIALS